MGGSTSQTNNPGGTDASGSGTYPGTGAVLSSLADSLGSVVETFEPARFSGDDASTLMSAFARIERLAVAGKTLAATRAAQANAHRTGGHRTPAHWVAEQTGESVGDAISTLALGNNLGDQPGVEEAFRKGKLSKPQAKAVTDAVQVNPGSSDQLLESAESDTLVQLRERCARAKAEAQRPGRPGTPLPLHRVRGRGAGTGRSYGPSIGTFEVLDPMRGCALAGPTIFRPGIGGSQGARRPTGIHPVSPLDGGTGSNLVPL